MNLTHKTYIISDRFYPVIGGAENQAFLLAKGFNQKSMDTEVITFSKKFNDKKNIKGIVVNYLNSFTLKKNGFTSIFTIPIMIYFSNKMISSGSYIIIRGSFNWAFAISLLSIIKKIHLIFVVETNDYYKINNKKLLLNYFKYLRMKIINADHFVAVSKFIYNDLRSFYRLSNVNLIHNGINNTDINHMNNIPENIGLKFLFIGNVTYQKGLSYLIKYWNYIEKDFPEFQLSIIGEYRKNDPFFIKLNRIISTESIKNVFFLGQVKNASELMRNHDIYITLSKDEASPITIIEAMSYGLPIIYSNIPGHKDFFNGKYISLEVDLNELSESYLRMKKIFTKKDELRNIGKIMYQTYSKNYTLEKTISNYFTLLK